MGTFNWPINPTTFNAGPIEFQVDGIDTIVSVDTVTPALSTPLPVKVLDGTGVDVDFATETTLASILVDTTSLAAEDFATETTLASVLSDTTAIKGKDFATETTLAAASAKLPATLGQKTGANSMAVVLASDTTLPLPSGAATEATLASLLAKTMGTPVNFTYDEVALTYVPSGNGVGEIATVVWKLATVTQKTATFTYDGSNKLTGVVWS